MLYYSLYEYFLYFCINIFSMIVKIMKPSSSFSGVAYNEMKNEKGQSALLTAKNFGIGKDNLKKADYVNYMELVSSSNTRVINKQFHAVISCKGREYSPEQLRDIAEKYLEKMGYSNNPYLIYFHSDTNNNHVHLVSTRIDKQGNKVEHSFEKARSLKIMNEILNIDLNHKAKEDLKSTLDYSFSNIKQFKLILENSGWSVGEKDGFLSLYKGQLLHGKIDIAKVQEKASQYQPNEDRKKQITAILHKYSKGLSHIELKGFMKDKFGIDLIFHTGKGHTTPYGFTILDYNSKSAFKGSEIMDLKNILISPSIQMKIDACNSIVNVLINDDSKHTLSSFKSSLSKAGYTLSKNGQIGIIGSPKHLLKIDPNISKTLRYNSRLQQANLFNVSSSTEANVLSRLYFVKANDIVLNISASNNDNYIFYRDLMNSYLNNKLDIRELLNDNSISFVRHDKEIYLLDKERHNIISSSELGIDLKTNNQTQSIHILDTSDINHLGNDLNKYPDIASGLNMLEGLFDIMNQDMNVQSDSRKKKRGQSPKQ